MRSRTLSQLLLGSSNIALPGYGTNVAAVATTLDGSLDRVAEARASACAPDYSEAIRRLACCGSAG